MPRRHSSLFKSLVVRTLLAVERLQSGVTYNPFSESFYANPYPHYTVLRRQDPIHWSRLTRSWVLSRYNDIDAMLRDHRSFSSDPRTRFLMGGRRTLSPAQENDPTILFLDPPDHTRLRALVSKAFTPQVIAGLEHHIRDLTWGLLDAIDQPTGFDLMERLANPLPIMVIASLLGIPAADHAQFKLWSAQRARTLEPTLSADQREVARQAGQELDTYFMNIINARRKEPQDDLISALVSAEEAGDTLSEREMTFMLRLLLIAGNETTSNLIGNGLLALLRHPEQLQTLRAQPDLIPSAIEELLRYDSPVQTDMRYVRTACVLDGRQFKPGQGILFLLGAANHDPDVFTHPEQLDICRNEASHISFGRGIHHCLGAPLARLEGRIVFTALLERFKHIRLLTDQPRFNDTIILRGLTQLPLRATPA